MTFRKLTLSQIRTTLIILLVSLCSGLFGYRLGWNKTSLSEGLANPKSLLTNTQGSSPEGVDFSLFWLVWNRLEDNFLDPEKLVAKNMVYGAISGMTQALGDPYTTFLPPTENTTSKEDLSGKFGGVGIQLGYVGETLAVMAPMPESPAMKANLKAGDLILHLKDEKKDLDEDTKGISLPDAVSKIRGPIGDPITLTILSSGAENSREVILVRENIIVPSIELTFINDEGKEVDNGRYAHLQVIKFGDRTMKEWEEAVDKIVKAKSAGIVLDVRNNPGGYLQRAIDLASEFVPEGVVVQQQGRDKTETFSVNRRGRLYGSKLVVLVNKGSASAAEILAGALRDRVGAKLVGDNTFGKGTVQDAQELPGGAGLHVTIARWLLPSGDNIHEKGIKPDFEIGLDTSAENTVDTQLIKALEVLKNS